MQERSSNESSYYLNCSSCNEQAVVVNRKTNERIWHRCFGHLQRLARDKLVNGFDLFIDDCTHYTWVYVLKKKDGVESSSVEVQWKKIEYLA